MPLISVNGANLFYESTGTGPTVIHVHGAGIGRANWSALTPLVAKHFRVIDYDARGFGDSDAPVQPYSMELWADDLATLMQSLGIDRAHIHGTSMGGMVSMVFAAKYPHLVDRLILTATLAKYDGSDHLRRAIRGHLINAYGKGEEVLDYFCFIYYSREYIDSARGPEGRALLKNMIKRQTSIDVDKEVSKAIVAHDAVALLPSISAPTLVIGARSDIATPIDVGSTGAGARLIAERIPNAELCVVDGGHFVLFEAPEVICSAVVEFLQR